MRRDVKKRPGACSLWSAAALVAMCVLGGGVVLAPIGLPQHTKGSAAPRLFVREPVARLVQAFRERGKERVQFELRNTGGLPLEIRAIRVPCNCIDVSISRRLLAPGQATTLALLVPVPAQVGRWGQTIFLETNDPTNVLTALRVEGFVEARVAVVPAEVQLGNIPYGQEVQTAVQVLGPQGQPAFKVLDVQPAGPSVAVVGIEPDTAKSTSAQAVWTVRISVRSRQLPFWKSAIAVFTTDPREPQIQVPVEVRERPRFRIVPRVVTLSAPLEPTASAKVVRLVSNGREPLPRIARIDVPGWVRAETLPNRDDGADRVSIKVSVSTAPSPSESCTAAIKVVFEEGQVAEIPLLWVPGKGGPEGPGP